ncbi:MAG: hypothetical protein Tsb002_36960 [Wenzhouxiangellaceae bacterium]
MCVDLLESEFGALLKQLTPPEGVMSVARDMFKALWEHRLAYAQSRKQSLQAALAAKDQEIAKLLDRIVEADLPSVVKAYEKKIKKCEDDKIVIAEKLDHCGRPLRGFDETYRTAMAFLANPFKLWASRHLEHKRAVLKLVFSQRLTYVRGEGYRTAKTTLPFNSLGGFFGLDAGMVGGTGFEPVTPAV